MGTWGTPDTSAKIGELEKLMSKPIKAKEAKSLLSSYVGDDGLFDTLEEAQEHGEDNDVRGLVAGLLDLWANWYGAGRFNPPWDEGVRERARALVSGYENVDGRDVVGAYRLADEPSEIAAHVAHVLDMPAASARDFRVVPGGVPGVRVVEVPGRDKPLRIDLLWRVVEEPDDEMVAHLRESLLEAPAPGPAP